MLRLILGPLNNHRSVLGIFTALSLIVALTLLTEVGGLVLWLAYGIGETLHHRHRKIITSVAFITLYSIATLAILPAVAPLFGRVALNCFADGEHAYAANSPLYCVLNRHYVTPKVKRVLEDLSVRMAQKHPGSVVSYLDAGFPLGIGIPLLPHLSHNDGRKLDLAFFYKNKNTGSPIPKGGAWFIGYWAFAPAWALQNTNPASPKDGVLRWRLNWLQWAFIDHELDKTRTTDLVRFLTQGPGTRQVQRLFLEPNLKHHLGLKSAKIGFAGWNAARHDDHLHFQVF